MKRKKEFQLQWEQIIFYFEWDRVLKTMEALNWKWANSDGTASIPDYDQMLQTAKKMCKNAYELARENQFDSSVETVFSKTGGFTAMCYTDDYTLQLSFNVSEWECE